MVELIIQKCDGSKKGELCKELIEKACQNFFSCGVKKIENACNNRRTNLITRWQSKSLEAPMTEHNLTIPYRQGIEEIIPLFELNEPETIELYVLEGERSERNEGLAAMDIRPLNNEHTRWKLNVYLDVMSHSNNNLQWTNSGESIEEITYHELLHACGDNPWTGKQDGILRYNIVGITCVKELLGE